LINSLNPGLIIVTVSRTETMTRVQRGAHAADPAAYPGGEHLSTTQRAGVQPALSAAAVRAAITSLGLAVFWLLGMQDLHSLAKAAGFVVFANLGLGGLALLPALPPRRLVACAALVLNALVLLTATVQGFLFWLYGLTPKHIVVADALLGSNRQEAAEFVALYWQHLLLVAALPAAMIALLVWAERRSRHRVRAVQPPRRPRTRWIGAGLLAGFCALHLNPTMAEENPLVYWPSYFLDYRAQRAFMVEVKQRVGRELAAAARLPADYVGPPEQTVVLVLGESVNRANWSLYGYPRATTPELDRRRNELLVFRNVQSSDPATVQSLIKMLTPATLDAPDAWLSGPNVLALARNAGYRVYWLSNQEQADGPIQVLAEHAHEQVFVNSGRGREARSLDERLLPQLDRILAAPAPRKLVVVHMQGAHLRYDLRYPPAFDRFSGAEDGVAAGLRKAGRPYWIRQARNQYDNAMLYGDHVLSAILDGVRRSAAARPASLLFVSDHGQEVGHYRDFAGHSSTDPSGYQVPLLLWTSRADKLGIGARAALEARAYRTDNLDHTLVGLLDIRAGGYRPELDLLSNSYALRLAGAPVPMTTRR
jgi:heptose-I-phosphate ethanolaminephosphotransferase